MRCPAQKQLVLQASATKSLMSAGRKRARQAASMKLGWEKNQLEEATASALDNGCACGNLVVVSGPSAVSSKYALSGGGK